MFKKFILELIFLYLIGFNLIILSRLIPLGGLFALIILVIGISLNIRNKHIQNSNNLNLQGKLLISFFIFFISLIWSFGYFNDISSSLHQYLIYQLIIFCFIFLLYITSYVKLITFLNFNSKFVFIMSLLGFLSWVLIFFEIVTKDFTILDARDLGMHVYSWPYYLGLVLTNVDDDASKISGLLFFRSSGWAEEPAWAATYVVPSVIFLYFKKFVYKLNGSIIFLIIVSLFWLSCAAISSIISLLILVTISFIINTIKKKTYFKLFFLIILILLFIYPAMNILNKLDIASGFLESKVGNDAQTMQDTKQSIFWFVHPELSIQHIIWGVSLVVGIFTLFMSLKGIFAGGDSEVFGYIILYLFLQGAKRGWVWYSFDTFTIFYFYLLICSLFEKKSNYIVIPK